MRGRAARIGQIHLHHLPVAAVQQPLGIGLQSQNGLECRCQHQRCRRLHDSIARARYACRSVAPGLVLEYQHLSHRLRAYAPVCKSLASLGHPFPLLRFLSNRVTQLPRYYEPLSHPACPSWPCGFPVGTCMPPTELPVLLLRSSCTHAATHTRSGDDRAFIRRQTDWGSQSLATFPQ